MEILKIEKGKTYTYEEIKEIYKNAMAATLADPMDERNEKDEKRKEEMKNSDAKFTMFLSGMILFHTLEDNLFDQATTSTEKGFSLIIPTIMYWMLTFYQLKFFIMYGKRLFNTAFLITISPLVIIQNMFDKVGDGQAQAFKVWLNEYATNILIQPLHALLYMIFMSIASNIIETAPILALVFMAALSRGERVFKNVFRFKDSITVNGMKDNLSAKNLSKIGR